MTAAITLPPLLRFSAGWLRPGLLLWEADPGVPAAWPSRLAFSKPFLLMEGRDILPHPARAAVGGGRDAAPSSRAVGSSWKWEHRAKCKPGPRWCCCEVEKQPVSCCGVWERGRQERAPCTVPLSLQHSPPTCATSCISEVGFHPGLPFNSWLVSTSPSTAASWPGRRRVRMPKGTGWCHHGCHRSCASETHLHILVYHTWATAISMSPPNPRQHEASMPKEIFSRGPGKSQRCQLQHCLHRS